MGATYLRSRYDARYPHGWRLWRGVKAMISPVEEQTADIPERRIAMAADGDIAGWLISGTTDQRFIDNILVELCERLVAAGVPLARATLHFGIHHPQWLGARVLWRNGLSEAEISTVGYDMEDMPEYIGSPVDEIRSGAARIRRNLETGEGNGAAHSFYNQLASEGLTDYIAWPLMHTMGKRHIVSFASDRPGGFGAFDVDFLSSLLPLLALVSEIRLKNRMTRTLLETYVGPHASQQILDGVVTRGSGATVGAAIMICDLRDFTSISDLWPRDDVIELLNGYFDAICVPVERYGGEILKFMGDGLLAIFPLTEPDACTNLLRAIDEARIAMAALNERNLRKGHGPLGYGIGVHVGDVMYGNIGSRNRLDFTVIGPAVNIASRLETLTKTVGHQVLISREFADMTGCLKGMENIGQHLLRGLVEPIDIFAYH